MNLNIHNILYYKNKSVKINKPIKENWLGRIHLAMNIEYIIFSINNSNINWNIMINNTILLLLFFFLLKNEFVSTYFQDIITINLNRFHQINFIPG